MAKTCNNCRTKEETKTKEFENNQDQIFVRFVKSIIKRLWIAIIILIIVSILAPLCVHFGWVYYESQWETVDYAYEYSQDGQGTNIIGNQNEVLNGTETVSESENTP